MKHGNGLRRRARVTRALVVGAVGVAVLTAAIETRRGWGSSTGGSSGVLVVDDDNVDCFDAPFRHIMDAVKVSLPGDQIVVCPGTYAEQVVITQSLSISGRQSGARRAVIQPVTLSASLPSVLSGNPVTAAILVDSTTARIDNVDVDLSHNAVAGCSPLLTGIYYRNSRGALSATRVTGAQVNGHPDCESGVGTYVESGRIEFFGLTVTGRSLLLLQDDLFAEYQKAGLVANGPNTVIRALGVKAVGSGPSAGPVQTGVQLGFGAVGGIQDSRAESLESTLPLKTATGFLFYSTTRSSLRRNTTVDAQTGVFIVGSRDRVKNGEVLASSNDGMVILGDRNRLANNDIGTAGVSGVFIDGEDDQVTGGEIANTPVGVWLHTGQRHQVRGVTFTNVPDTRRTGGTRMLDATAVTPFVTTCNDVTDCNDGNACTVDSCDVSTGRCSWTNQPDGTSCADSTVCNGAETCVAGSCTAGTPLNCDDGNACTVDTCDAVLGCQHGNVADGTPCATGTCLGGACV